MEGETEKAREYVRSHILLPSSLLGLVFMLSGMGFLGYQFLFEEYEWRTFVETSGLLVLGILLGYAQTRYHRYLLRAYPEHFASRMRTFSRGRRPRGKRESVSHEPEHAGRSLVPLWYLLGVVLLVGLSTMSSLFGHVYYPAALTLPWAGFFWAKVFFWRTVIAPVRK